MNLLFDMKNEIRNRKDIELLVDSFYTDVRKDALIGPVFNGVIQNRWPQHLETMYRFWETVLLNNSTYRGNPFMPHSELPIEKKHFDRWLTLFHATLDDYFSGTVAEEAKWRSNKMAEMFQMKLEYYKGSPSKPLI